MQTTAGATVAQLIAARGHHRSYDEGEPLFYEGDRSLNVFACERGRIRVYVTLASGRELTMGRKEPGEIFGELSALDQRPRAASAVAEVRTVVSTMPGDDFLDELRHAPLLGVEVLRGLADQLRRTNARLRARNGESALVRTGHLLIEMSSLKLRHDREAEHIELELTQDDLAEWIGSTRESTARALARFRDAGVLRTARGCIHIDDLAGLVSLVEAA